jgi:hypothetical protein
MRLAGSLECELDNNHFRQPGSRQRNSRFLRGAQYPHVGSKRQRDPCGKKLLSEAEGEVILTARGQYSRVDFAARALKSVPNSGVQIIIQFVGSTWNQHLSPHRFLNNLLRFRSVLLSLQVGFEQLKDPLVLIRPAGRLNEPVVLDRINSKLPVCLFELD